MQCAFHEHAGEKLDSNEALYKALHDLKWIIFNGGVEVASRLSAPKIIITGRM